VSYGQKPDGGEHQDDHMPRTMPRFLHSYGL
jgi:hypothetical protein